jgi:hypothetical protein
MEKRLQRIKDEFAYKDKWLDKTGTMFKNISEDVDWLISEVESHKKAIDYIEKSIWAELATRNHSDMNSLEKGIQQGLHVADNILRSAKQPLETEGGE